MRSELYVVTGVTGRTGSVVAETLLKDRKRVRVVVRNKAKGESWLALGAEVVVADLVDHTALAHAFSGADGAYIVSPPQYDSEKLILQAQMMASSVAQAAITSQLSKLVVLSSVGAEQGSGTGWIGMNRTLEQELAATGLPVTFIRAAYFIENWGPMIKQAFQHGRLPSFLAPLDRPIPMVATNDIGYVAAQTLCEHWQGVRVIGLEGPMRYSPNDVAQYLSEIIGTEILASVIPEHSWANAVAEQGFSSSALSGFIEMTQGINSGHIAFNGESEAEHCTGSTPMRGVLETLAQ